MHRSMKEIAIPIVLTLVLPSVLFSFFELSENKAQQLGTTVQINAEKLIGSSEDVSVLLDDGSVTTMELSEYLTAVLLREMPAEFEIEALKAQAVVARTYTLRRLDMKPKHSNAAVCTDPGCCQGFCLPESYIRAGGNEEGVQKIFDAISATAGEVLIYDNQLIEATYFSCSGGMTEDAAAVWGSEIPYLVATESPGEEKAAHYTDTVTFTTEEFAKKLGISIPAQKGLRTENIAYTPGGGVEIIRICGQDYTGTFLRRKLGLRSTAFVLSVVGNTVTITTKGFGHRVGMSQYGADAMAVQGNTYRQILAHYYRGTELVSRAVIDNAN